MSGTQWVCPAKPRLFNTLRLGFVAVCVFLYVSQPIALKKETILGGKQQTSRHQLHSDFMRRHGCHQGGVVGDRRQCLGFYDCGT